MEIAIWEIITVAKPKGINKKENNIKNAIAWTISGLNIEALQHIKTNDFPLPWFFQILIETKTPQTKEIGTTIKDTVSELRKDSSIFPENSLLEKKET